MVKVGVFYEEEQIIKSSNLISNPTISIIMPTFCRGDDGLLEKSIESILSQTFSDFELIIVDDGSVDSTRQIIEKKLCVDNRIVYIRNDLNSGLPAVRCNQAYRYARGRYICYQFDDDTWRKNALEALIHGVEDKNEDCVVYGASMIHDLSNGQEYKFLEKFDYSELLVKNRIANNSVIIPKNICEKFGLYDCHILMRRLCDWDLWIRYAKHVPFYPIDVVISDVTLCASNSLGNTCVYDLNSTRIMMNVSRTEQLCPGSIIDYQIDSLPDVYSLSEKNQLFNRHILPWYISHKKEFDGCDENIYEIIPVKKRIIISKYAYDSTVDIMILNFLDSLGSKFDYLFVPEEQLGEFEFSDKDILFLCRATQKSTLDKIKSINIPVVYFIDDDLLNIYKLGLDYIAPGTEMYETVEKLLFESDAVVSFSDSITKTVQRYNSKVIQLSTNIQSKYIEGKEYIEEGAFKIFFAGGNARKKEFEQISSQLIQLSDEYGDKVEFEFWGYIPEEIKKISKSKVTYIPYNSNYRAYIDKLSQKKFNLLLCPLNDSEYNRAKSPIKYLEAQACCAIGLFSDMPVYNKDIIDGKNGFLIDENGNWYNKINDIIKLPIEYKQEVFKNANELVGGKYSTNSLTEKFCYAIQLAQLARKLRKKKIMYVAHSPYYAGAESVIFKHALLMKRAGFDVLFALPSACKDYNEDLQRRLEDNNIPIIYFVFSNYTEIEQFDNSNDIEQGELIVRILQDNDVGLVHNCTLIPALAYACKIKGIPLVSSLYKMENVDRPGMVGREFLPDYIHSDAVGTLDEWIAKLKIPGECIRNYIEESGNKCKIENVSEYRIAVVGSVQSRKGQLEAIKAVYSLIKKEKVELFIYGYDSFYKDYYNECIQFIKENSLDAVVHMMGFCENVPADMNEKGINILLCASTYESLPQSILEAVTERIPVVSTPVGYVNEILGNDAGFIAEGFEATSIASALCRCIDAYKQGDIDRYIDNAYVFIKENCSAEEVTTNLLKMYSSAFNLVSEKNGLNIALANKVHFAGNCNKSLAKKVIRSSDLRLSSLIKNKRQYLIKVDEDSLSGIRLIFTSFTDNIGNGNVSVRVRLNNRIVRESNVHFNAIKNNEWCDFTFERLYGVKGKSLIIEIAFACSGEEKLYGVYEYSPNITIIHKAFNKMKLSDRSCNVLYYDLIKG